MLQACLQGVDLKADRDFGEGQRHLCLSSSSFGRNGLRVMA